MFRASTAYHQEVKCIDVANGTSKLTVSGPGPLRDALKVKNKYHSPHYTHGLLMMGYKWARNM
jgi:hypothetical protein